MTLALGVIATSPAGGEQTHEREVAHDFELVDFQPLDTGDDEAMMEESDDDTSGETPEESEHGTSAETPTEGTDTESPTDSNGNATEPSGSYKNCTEAFLDGAANLRETDPGWGPHLDGDNDGVGCEQSPDTDPSSYQNCDEAATDGKTDIQSNDPAYAEHLDRDNDGVACES